MCSSFECPAGQKAPARRGGAGCGKAGACPCELYVREGGATVALAGNPNVGKSTVFNALTGLKQHTGNWPGKTVMTAQGIHKYKGRDYTLVDLPGTYSLMAKSAEEEIARDFLLLGGADAAVVVCDAGCLERSLNLALQTMELTPRVAVCVNLMDEAKKKGIEIDLRALEERLGVPVAGTSARSGKGLEELMERVQGLASGEISPRPKAVKYPEPIEEALAVLEPALSRKPGKLPNGRWLALRLLEGESLTSFPEELRRELIGSETVASAVREARQGLERAGIGGQELQDMIVAGLLETAGDVCEGAVRCAGNAARARDHMLDKILTGKLTGIPIMILLLCGVLWLSIIGANYPSQLISDFLFYIQDLLTGLFMRLGAPDWLHGALVLGVYRVLAWVVSVIPAPRINHTCLKPL